MALGMGSAKQWGLLPCRILARRVKVEPRSFQVTIPQTRKADLPLVLSFQPQPSSPSTHRGTLAQDKTRHLAGGGDGKVTPSTTDKLSAPTCPAHPLGEGGHHMKERDKEPRV